MREFNGVVVLTAEEFDRMIDHMSAPCEVTEAAMRGAALLEQLYGSSAPDKDPA